MRRIYRGGLPTATRLEMYRRGKLCTDADTAKGEWKSFRPSVAARPMVVELTRMAGVRNRCFYCSDGRGADVDHFVPIALDVANTMRWSNLLWVCPECNRKKNATFPMEDGEALLIDPSVTDPWSQVILDVTTGVLAPRFHGAVPDRGAAETLRVLDILNQEPVAEGRKKSVRRLVHAAELAIAGPDLPSASKAMWLAVGDDDYGVAAWFALWEGQDTEPYSAVKETRPRIWRHLIRCATGRSRP
jgi:5-methylcytosine-specific restriction endonuclease McrA